MELAAQLQDRCLNRADNLHRITRLAQAQQLLTECRHRIRRTFVAARAATAHTAHTAAARAAAARVALIRLCRCDGYTAPTHAPIAAILLGGTEDSSESLGLPVRLRLLRVGVGASGEQLIEPCRRWLLGRRWCAIGRYAVGRITRCGVVEPVGGTLLRLCVDHTLELGGDKVQQRIARVARRLDRSQRREDGKVEGGGVAAWRAAIEHIAEAQAEGEACLEGGGARDGHSGRVHRGDARDDAAHVLGEE